MIVLQNDSSTEIILHLALSTADDTILDADFEIGPGDRRSVDSKISNPGEYDVSITVEGGPATSPTVSIDDVAVQNGSNLIAEINEDDIRLLIQQ